MAGRKRRSADEARAELLRVAEDRLARYGLEGLNIVDVAGAAGMSHATLIHHFGSTEDMRRALVTRMTDRLLRDVIAVLETEANLAPEKLLRDLFSTLSKGGHAKLLAWLAVEQGLSQSADPAAEIDDLFAELVPIVAKRLPTDADGELLARRMIYLIATSAIGYGIAGDTLANLIKLDHAEVEDYPAWLGAQVREMLELDTD
jgi:AcrR family transcriptional regulator